MIWLIIFKFSFISFKFAFKEMSFIAIFLSYFVLLDCFYSLPSPVPVPSDLLAFFLSHEFSYIHTLLFSPYSYLIVGFLVLWPTITEHIHAYIHIDACMEKSMIVIWNTACRVVFFFFWTWVTSLSLQFYPFSS